MNASTTDLRTHGAALITAASTARTADDWAAMPKINGWPFAWGSCWQNCITIAVNDPETEIGWLHSVLGMSVFAWDAEREYLMMSSPDSALLLGIGRVREDAPALPEGSMLLELMLEDIEGSAAALAERGVEFDEPIRAPWGDAHPMRTAWLRTPGGIRVRLWGMVEVAQPVVEG